MHLLWAIRSLKAILTDFSESRSTVLQTKSVSNTTTQRVFRGSPAYMAPEALANDNHTVGIDQLKAMDVWSLGMVVFTLINPGTIYPYMAEMNEMGDVDRSEMLKRFHKMQRLPRHHAKYMLQHESVWKPLHKMFVSCAKFNASTRSKIDIIRRNLLNDCVVVTPLAVSQSSLSDMLSEEAAFTDSDLQINMSTACKEDMCI